MEESFGHWRDILQNDEYLGTDICEVNGRHSAWSEEDVQKCNGEHIDRIILVDVQHDA